MSGKKISTLLIVLVALVSVFLTVKFTKNTGRSKSYHSELVKIDTAKVSKIEIYSVNDTTEIEKSGADWKVNQKYAGDAVAIKGLFANLQRIIPGRLASRSEDSWKDYQVDESGTRVAAYEGGEKVLDIVLGRFNVEGQRTYSTYVRLADESDVYVAKDFMKIGVSEGSAAYRNDDVLKLVADSVSSVSFNYPDSAFSLVKGLFGWEVAGAPADSASVAKYLQGLRFLSSRKFADYQHQVAASEVIYQTQSGEKITVKAFDGGLFNSTSNPQEYWNDDLTKAKIFKRKEDFVVKH